MLRGIVFTIALMLLLSTASVTSCPLALTPYSATYTAKYNGLNLKAVRTLTPLGDHRYQIATRASHFIGHINESSEFILQPNNYIRPQYYEMDRRIFGIGKSESTRFNWQDSVANYQSSKGKAQEVALTDNDLDWLGYQVQLSIDLKAGKREFHYPIVRRGSNKDYQFTWVGEETIDTPMGKVDTVKLRQVRENSSKQTELWLAPGLEYLLVKLHQIEEDGDEYELYVKDVELKPSEKSQ